MRFLLLMLLVLSTLSGCKDQVNLNFDRVDKRLVVDGTIFNTDGPYYINLSYSAKYTYAPDSTGAKARRVTGAQVTVTDDVGNTFLFTENSPGLYVSDKTEFKGIVERSYVLHIHTADNKIYKSSVERLNAVAPIDSLYYQNVDGEDRLYIDLQDPPGLGNYYQWRIIFNGAPNDWIDIDPDDYFDGKYLKGLRKAHGKFPRGPVEVDQLSITKKKYKFLYLLDQQLRDVGTQFDPPSAPIVGNVYNEADSTDYTLGYFGASAISTKSITIR